MVVFRVVIAVALAGVAFRWLVDPVGPLVRVRPTPLEPAPVQFLSTKTPYSPPADSVFFNESVHGACQLAHVNYLSRHGSRHSNKLDSTAALVAALQAAGAWC